MAAAVLCSTLALAVTKTFLLVDALFQPGGGAGVVARVTKSFRLVSSSPRHTISESSQRGGSIKVGSLHRRLLCMHVTSSLLQGAGAAKYFLPVSDTSCVVTNRIHLVNVVLYQSSLVLFFLAKAHVTNGNRDLACWEKGLLWWSRFFSILYLPLVAFMIGSTFETTANPEASFCLSRISEAQKSVAVIGDTLLVSQFILLLGLFVKPMLIRVEGTQSGGALYRRVVMRNIVCTTGTVISYAITSVVIVVTLSIESSANDSAVQVRDSVVGLNSFVTLCLTEITLPLGFSSCLATCSKTRSERPSANSQARGRPTKLGTTHTGTTTLAKKVVPVQMPLPSHTP